MYVNSLDTSAGVMKVTDSMGYKTQKVEIQINEIITRLNTHNENVCARDERRAKLLNKTVHTSRISPLLKHSYLEANLFISWLPVIFK